MSLGKNAPLQKCALCSEVRHLVESHIIPRWVYARIAADQPGRPVPVVVKDGVAMMKSEQLTKYLLCRPCEDQIGRWEKHAAQVSYNAGQFPALTTALANVAPDRWNTPKITITDLSSLDADALARFGTSVFWRAASCPDLCPTIRLGKYKDELRAYLRKEAPFPETVRRILWLLNTPDLPQAQQILTMPSFEKEKTTRMYHFGVFGLYFELWVGGQHLGRLHLACLARTGRAAVTNGYRQVPGMYAEAGRAKPKGAFAKHMAERRRNA
jgi:hypothetical protein